MPPGCTGEGAGTADFCYDPADEIGDVVLDDETRNGDDSDEDFNTGVKSIGNEGDDSNAGVVVAVVVVVVVTVVLLAGYWFYTRPSSNEQESTPLEEEKDSPEVMEQAPENDAKELETDHSEESEEEFPETVS